MKNDVRAHLSTKRHKDIAKSASTSKSVASFFRSNIPDSTSKAEVMWSMFVAKYNFAFLNSDHANRLFREMFPDSAIAKIFACGRIKTAAIVKEALAPHYQKEVVNNLSYPFSILMHELNDKVKKSCIILVKVLDSEIGDVRTRFLDMPVVNIGNAQNLFAALKASLGKCGRIFQLLWPSNVMKGAWSGVQKLIKNE